MFRLPDHIATAEPAWQCPSGPVFAVAGPELGVDWEGEFLVRRLAGGRDFLTTGAVLRQVADLDRPHAWGPAFWARVDDETWIATLRPAGGPLALERPSRMTFPDALDVWRPLAEAVAAWHRRGAVHGNLTPWTVCWEQSTRRLSTADGGTWVDESLVEALASWWPPELRVDIGERFPSPASDVYGLARLLLALTLPQAEWHERPNFEGLPGYAIPTLDRALSPAPAERPQRVAELLAGLAPAPRRSAHVDDVRAGVDVLFGRVREVERVNHPKNGAGVKFYLSHPAYDEDGVPTGYESTGTFFFENRGSDVYESVRHVWNGAELNLLDAERIEDSQGVPFFTARPETLPVLEPHWPVAVSNVLKAEGCVSRYFVDLREPGEPNWHLVFGSFMHAILDSVARSTPTPTFEEAWAEHFPRQRLGMVAAGIGDEEIPRFRREARDHFAHIAGFARGRDDSGGQRMGWSGESVEVTRYSPVYGLEGRIDLVTEDRRSGLHIVELKTGSERDEHVSQVRCYRLLWDGVAQGQQMAVTGYLLYSKSGLMRSTPSDDPLRERRILRARNELIAAHVGLQEGAEDYRLPAFMDVPRNCNASECRFRKDRCRAHTELLGMRQDADPKASAAPGGPWSSFDATLVDRAWRYHSHFTRLVELENWEDGVALGEILQTSRLRERVANHRAIAGLRLEEIDVDGGHVTFLGDIPRVFVEGDSVVAHRGDFHAEHILRGRVVSVDSSHLTMWTMGAPNASALARDGWVMDSLPFRMGQRAAYRAMFELLQRRDTRLLEILLAPGSANAIRDTTPATDERRFTPQTVAALNERQLDAVHWGLTTHGGCLVQGPPGTGKTTVIAHLIRELVDDGSRIIVAAQTNTAVDTVLRKLVDVGMTRFLRIGSSGGSNRLATELREEGYDPEDFFSAGVAERTESLDELARRLAHVPVIACTTHKAVGDPVIEFLRRTRGPVPFDVAIVDEATQINEPMTLAPLRLARRFVLVGDHQQLGPIVQNERAATVSVRGWSWEPEEELPTPKSAQLGLFGAREPEPPGPQAAAGGWGGLDESLFQRLVRSGTPYVMLEEQYRMSDEVQAFSSRSYYDDSLRAHESVSSARLGLDPEAVRRLPDRERAVVDPDAPVVFCHVEGEDVGRTNEAEADAVVATILALRSCGTPETLSIGVVTPFRAQGQLLRRKLQDALGAVASQIDVDTVERYQGSERDAILVSLVKTEQAGEFLTDERRLNVTLTRARRKLVLFGHRPCLSLNPSFRELIEQPETTNVDWS